MINRIGISIQAREVRAILIRGNVVIGHASVDRPAGVPIGESIASLMALLPRVVGVRRVTVAIGPSACHVKQIDGLPAIDDLMLLTRLLHENSACFFLGAGDRLAISQIARLGEGKLWAAAFDHELSIAAIDALKKQRILKPRIVPAVAAVASLVSSGVSHWTDGEHNVEIATDEQARLMSVRRLVVARDVLPRSLSGPITQLGDEAWDYAAAFGAALLPKSAAFVWRPAPDRARVARLQRVRIALIGLMCVSSAIAAVAAPGLRADRIVRRSSSEMDALRPAQTAYARAQGELRRTALTLERIERFQAERGKTILLLGALSEALPESTALVTLRLDSLEGAFVAVTPHASRILPQLSPIPEFASARMVGSLTKEVSGVAPVERVTVRFKRTAAREHEPSVRPQR